MSRAVGATHLYLYLLETKNWELETTHITTHYLLPTTHWALVPKFPCTLKSFLIVL